MNECVNVLNKSKEGSMPIVKSAYQKIISYFSIKTYMWVLKRTVSMRGSLKHPKTYLNLCCSFWLSWKMIFFLHFFYTKKDTRIRTIFGIRYIRRLFPYNLHIYRCTLPIRSRLSLQNVSPCDSSILLHSWEMYKN